MIGAARTFEKYEGLGNDFLLIEAASEVEVSDEDAARLCDRRLGVGGDGVLVLLPPRLAGLDARMQVRNADGSIPEMCGNGVRCVALHLARGRGLRRGTVNIETDAGPRACAVDDTGRVARVTVDMGPVRVMGERSIEVEGRAVSLIEADAGNPHAVLFGAFTAADAAHLGQRVAAHAAFPGGTNVEFARVAGGGVDLVVWERGVGLTLACGTGACAAAAVACAQGLLPRGAAVPVRLPGGVLDVTIDHAGRAIMTGPARHVFSGRTAPTQG